MQIAFFSEHFQNLGSDEHDYRESFAQHTEKNIFKEQ